MSKTKLKKNDQVICIIGKDKGKKGKVLKIFTEKGTALVDGINVGKKHTKARPPKVPRGGIIDKALPVQLSNLKLVCSNCQKPSRLAMKVKSDGTKERICKKCGQAV